MATILLVLSACDDQADAVDWSVPACAVGDLPAIERALHDEFGGWAPDGGRTVWCDLPSIQATADGRDVFVPLGGADDVTYEACTDSASDGRVCGEPWDGWDGATATPWRWVCEDGSSHVLGTVVSWSCAGTERVGDPTAAIVGRWNTTARLDEARAAYEL